MRRIREGRANFRLPAYAVKSRRALYAKRDFAVSYLEKGGVTAPPKVMWVMMRLRSAEDCR